MRTIRLVASALLIASSAESAQHYQFFSGIDLIDMCKVDQNGCVGYVSGVSDAHSELAAMYPSIERFCAPEAATNGQFQLIVEKWLKKHPEKLHSNAAGLVLVALGDAFPCEKKKK